MTCIAWDGATLAGDRLETWDRLPFRGRGKLARLRQHKGGEYLCGFSGTDHGRQAFTKWFVHGEMPPAMTDRDLCVLLIDRKCRVFQCNERLTIMRVNGTRWAAGTGADYALGAMAYGASSVEAVRIAIKLDVYCGGGVTTLRWE